MIHCAIRGGTAAERLGDGDVCGILGIVKGLDVEGGGGVAWGRGSGHGVCDQRRRTRAPKTQLIEHSRADATGHVEGCTGHLCCERARNGRARFRAVLTALYTSFLSFLSSTICFPRHARRHSQEKKDCRPRLPLSW